MNFESVDKLMELAKKYIESDQFKLTHGNIGNRAEDFKMGIEGFLMYLRNDAVINENKKKGT